jgi:SAM-dependent methyltransferase
VDTLYSESAYYRMLFAERTRDLAFYVGATEGAERVLELGVGTGRVAIVLAEHGRSVTGVDRSPEMLAELERKLAQSKDEIRGRVAPLCADVRALALGRRFPRVICPFNGVAHFHGDAAIEDFFRAARTHLEAGGHFAFDAMIPDPALLAGGSSYAPRVEHPRTGAVCRLEERYEYDAASRVLTITTTFIGRADGSRQDLSLALRQFDPEEMRALIEHHGFSLDRCTDLGDAIGYLCH